MLSEYFGYIAIPAIHNMLYYDIILHVTVLPVNIFQGIL